MKFEAEAVKIESPAVEEVIKDILCKGYALVAAMECGWFVLSDEITSIAALSNKEMVMASFAGTIQAIKDGDVVTREDWDNLHLIVIHCPEDVHVWDSYLNPFIKVQAVILNVVEFQQYAMPISRRILELKAFDLHDDVLAQALLERQTEQIEG